MDNPRSAVGNAEDRCTIPDDLRCKRSDGKQWRCTAMSMPDKTVCEKHYIQAKKRAANSAMRASLKKAKKKSVDNGAACLESKSDDVDMPIAIPGAEDYPGLQPGKKYKEKIPKNQVQYSLSPPLRTLSAYNPMNLNDDLQRDVPLFEESQKAYATPPPFSGEQLKNFSQRSSDSSATSTSEDDGSTESSTDMGGLTCHQCRRNSKNSVVWCRKCDRRGYCSNCISKWYSDMALEDILRACPACRGTCNCKVCSRGDNLVKARVKEIPVLAKLQYLYCLLSSVLPVVKCIHQDQLAEVELEKKLHGNVGELERTKLNADDLMCCDCCRVPIVDFHRHCVKCSFDVCLRCCQDLREESISSEAYTQMSEEGERLRLGTCRLSLGVKFPGWKANNDGSIPCLPMEYGGCGHSLLSLQRIFKMNWVAKVVKNLEEMVNGCSFNDTSSFREAEAFSSSFLQFAFREGNHDNFLYSPSLQDIRSGGIDMFLKYWSKGMPVIIKQVFDISSVSSWDPMVIWREINDTIDERVKDADRTVKAVDCLDGTEVDIELGQYLRGYSEGCLHEDGLMKMLKLRDWPSPSASEEFLLYQRPEFITKMPLLEFIHYKWGLLNIAAKLPHYSLPNDVGPKILISYGLSKESDGGNPVANLRLNMKDMVYLLVHTSEANLKVSQVTQKVKTDGFHAEAVVKDASVDPRSDVNEASCSNGSDRRDECWGQLNKAKDVWEEKQCNEAAASFHEKTCDIDLNMERGVDLSLSHPGAIWDVFRRQDVPKLAEYLHAHLEELQKPNADYNDHAVACLFDETIYLNMHHMRILKEELGIEPWSFEQCLGEAVFIPAGCPFQVRNLQSTVQLSLDFLSPESLGETMKLSEEIRRLPNDRAAKLQMVEVGKLSLYAASSAIKEVKKLVLDPKLGRELGFEDPNLTAAVSDNLEKMVKQRQAACA